MWGRILERAGRIQEMVSDDFSSGNNVLHHVLCTDPIIYLYDMTEFLETTHMCSLKHRSVCRLSALVHGL